MYKVFGLIVISALFFAAAVAQTTPQTYLVGVTITTTSPQQLFYCTGEGGAVSPATMLLKNKAFAVTQTSTDPCMPLVDLGDDLAPIANAGVAADGELVYQYAQNFVQTKVYVAQNPDAEATCTPGYITTTYVAQLETMLKAFAPSGCVTKDLSLSAQILSQHDLVDGVCADCKVGVTKSCETSEDCLSDICAPTSTFLKDKLTYPNMCWYDSVEIDNGDDNGADEESEGEYSHAKEVFLIAVKTEAESTEQLERCTIASEMDDDEEEDNNASPSIKAVTTTTTQRTTQNKFNKMLKLVTKKNENTNLTTLQDDNNSTNVDGCDIWIDLGVDIYPVADAGFDLTYGVTYKAKEKYFIQKMYVVQSANTDAICNKDYVENVFFPDILNGALEDAPEYCQTMKLTAEIQSTHTVSKGVGCKRGLGVECDKGGNCLSGNCQTLPDEFQQMMGEEKVCFFKGHSAGNGAFAVGMTSSAVVAAVVMALVGVMLF